MPPGRSPAWLAQHDIINEALVRFKTTSALWSRQPQLNGREVGANALNGLLDDLRLYMHGISNRPHVVWIRCIDLTFAGGMTLAG
jgi:hypothetical protein